jgi:hypothetical protein
MQRRKYHTATHPTARLIFSGGTMIERGEKMKSITKLGKDLYWMQPTLRRSYELRAGKDIFATMVFKTELGSLATVKSLEKTWTFKRVGFFKPRITVREKDTETDLLVYSPQWGSADGVFEIVDGDTYVWKLANHWATQYQVVDLEGEPLISYTSKIDRVSDLIKDQAKVEIGKEMQNGSHLILLIAIGWYLIVLQQGDVMETAMAVVNRATSKKK